VPVMVLSLLRQRRAQAIGGGVIVVAVALLALVLTPADRDEVVAAGESTTTVSDVTTTSTSVTTTTTAESTTTTPVATTSTSPPPTSTTVTPPTSAPPGPPPAPSAQLDRREVLAWAKAHRPSNPGPYTYSGSSCEAWSGRLFDDGDDVDGDINTTSLIRDCNGNYRAFVDSDGDPSWYWVEVNARPGGCGEIDVFAVIWRTASSAQGSVVSTPSCEPSTWKALETAANPGAPTPGLIDFGGTTFGDPPSFGWRSGVLGSPGDPTIDLAPSGGFAPFAR
jgi:hypothetical protein